MIQLEKEKSVGCVFVEGTARKYSKFRFGLNSRCSSVESIGIDGY